jgi:hypothetical protein
VPQNRVNRWSTSLESTAVEVAAVLGDACFGAEALAVGMRVARPKSTSFTCLPPFTSMMFSSLMSRLEIEKRKKKKEKRRGEGGGQNRQHNKI